VTAQHRSNGWRIGAREQAGLARLGRDERRHGLGENSRCSVVANGEAGSRGTPNQGRSEAEQGQRQWVPGAQMKSKNGEDAGARD
jgi:hypothetical protein